MKFTALMPVLWTEDLFRTLNFYRDCLGFRSQAVTEGWALLERDGIELMLSLPNQLEPYDGPRFSGSFYFRCENVDAWWERLKDAAPVVYPVEDFDYGMREFAIRDNNGYILQFGKSLTDDEVATDELGPPTTVERLLGLASGTVFHINQLIVPIMGYAQFAREKLEPAHPAVKEVEKIQEVADAAEKCLKDLRTEIRRMQDRSIAIATRRRPRK